MSNQHYFINRYFETLKTILKNPDITWESRLFIDNYFCKLEQLIINNEENESKELFKKNHYLLMDVYTSNLKILLPDENKSDSDDEIKTKIIAKKKEPVQKPKVIPQNDVPQPEQPEKIKSFVTFEEQHTNILTNKNLLR